FFAMVFFAALTSGISILEAIVSSFMDRFKISRKKSTVMETVIALIVGVVVCLGYNLLYFELKLPNGSTGQILDVLDYLSNYILMPVVALASCLLIGWVAKPDTVLNEVTKNGEKFHRRTLYKIMVRFVAPALIIVILLMSFGVI
ncbi:MAG: sodium-dependent transporter, partial [Lachnospiraceae bacterium]|nr:sodium-dependent transporter [Lachnospiraceae bacterium]